jgi:cyclohexyl-isocyanide hydratase
MPDPGNHLEIGAIIFPEIDQADFTGPFEVLSCLPNSSFHVLWKEMVPVRDFRGLILTPNRTFAEVPPLDLLVVPGGRGQEALMDDETVLGFIRAHAAGTGYVFSVCTGALLCGAAGILRGVRCTTHWSAHHLLKYFGAIPVDQRVVVDRKHISAAGVTAGLDGALRATTLLRNDRTARQIQLSLEYEPDPPFKGGSPRTAEPEVLEAARAWYRPMNEARLATAQRVAQRLGVEIN